MKARYVILGAATDLTVRCLFNINYFFKSEITYFVLIGSHGIVQGLALNIVFVYCF